MDSAFNIGSFFEIHFCEYLDLIFFRFYIEFSAQCFHRKTIKIVFQKQHVNGIAPALCSIELITLMFYY